MCNGPPLLSQRGRNNSHDIVFPTQIKNSGEFRKELTAMLVGFNWLKCWKSRILKGLTVNHRTIPWLVYKLVGFCLSSCRKFLPLFKEGKEHDCTMWAMQGVRVGAVVKIVWSEQRANNFGYHKRLNAQRWWVVPAAVSPLLVRRTVRYAYMRTARDKSHSFG